MTFKQEKGKEISRFTIGASFRIIFYERTPAMYIDWLKESIERGEQRYGNAI